MSATHTLLHKTIATRYALYILSVFCLVYIYFIGFVDAGYPTDFLSRLIDKISALQAILIYLVIEIIRRVDINYSIRIVELVGALFVSLIVFALIFRYPECALALITITVTIRFIKTPIVNVAALAIAAFSFQYAASFGPLMEFHKAFAYIDAAVIKFILHLIGLPIEGNGTSVFYRPTQVHLIIGSGCTSSLAAAYSAGPAVVYLIYQRARFHIYVVIAMLTLFATVIVMNWLRIALMLESREALNFWHYGTGMQIVSLINSIVIFIIMHVGVLKSRYQTNKNQISRI